MRRFGKRRVDADPAGCRPHGWGPPGSARPSKERQQEPARTDGAEGTRPSARGGAEGAAGGWAPAAEAWRTVTGFDLTLQGPGATGLPVGRS